jgi:large subunit ribosomal protein L6
LSRIGKKTIAIPKGVEVKIQNNVVSVKGPVGTISRTMPASVKVEVKDNEVHCLGSAATAADSAVWGLNRMLVNNMVEGAITGFKRDLEINGVGYKAELKGKDLVLNVGYSHPVTIKAPQGIQYVVEAGTKLSIKGIDKELVGQLAAEIRSVRPPEPYKGKGIKYAEEHIKRKAGKTAGK